MLSAGATIERYEVMGLLGEGNTAHVYLVRHRLLGSEHVLKVLKDPSPAGRARLLREGQVQARLRHPNVVEVTDVLEVQGAPALLMERVDGPSLDRVLAAGRLAPERIEGLVPGICAGLAAAHAFGVVHRDLKPANVLLALRGDAVIPKIADFGLVKHAHREGMEAQTATHATLGTPVYMAPEQVRGTRDVDARADVWALGALLYELVIGRRAFRGLSVLSVLQAVAARRYVPPEKVDPTLPARWCAAIDACLQLLDRRAPSVEAVFATWSGGQALGDPAPAIWPVDEVARLREQVPPPSPLAPVAEPTLAASIGSPPVNLPRERDVFVGRDAELDALGRRLESGARLVTLVGFGGAGKTRLATRFGWSRREAFAGGVHFCDLSEARGADGIVAGVARALDLPLGRQDPVIQLGHAIAGRGPCLLLLDNTEQVTAEIASMVGRWLDRAPEAVFLVTSREVLGLPGEHVVPLEPLPTTDGAALFVARATQVEPDFVPDDRASIDALVGLLDGLPLAIELVAARARTMSPAMLLARMSERFRLVSGSGRPSRHASLRGALDGSWELLTDDERQALAQLSVFEGGFTLEAVEGVLGLASLWPADAVQALVDKSLVRRVGSGRFDLLLSVRAYAAERLEELGGRAEVEARHGVVYARHGTEQACEALMQHGGVLLRRRLRAELGNLQSAVRRAVTRGAGDVAVGALRAAWEVLTLEGPFREGRSLAEAVLAMPGLPPSGRVVASVVLGRALRHLGAWEEARALLEQTLTLAREVGDTHSAGRCLADLGVLHRQAGRIDAARAITRQVLESGMGSPWLPRGNLATLEVDHGDVEDAAGELEAVLQHLRAVGDRRNECHLMVTLGNARLRQGRLEVAKGWYHQATALGREIGDRRMEANALGNLGTVYRVEGARGEARWHTEGALAVSRAVGDRQAECVWLGNLGDLDLADGRLDDARARLDQALAIAVEIGSVRLEGVWRGSLGLLHRAEGHGEQAQAQLDAGIALLRRVGDGVELGKLLCGRARLEADAGRLGDAHATLAEVEALARDDAGPESELGRALADARRAIGSAP